jgi:hypothetical protein
MTHTRAGEPFQLQPTPPSRSGLCAFRSLSRGRLTAAFWIGSILALVFPALWYGDTLDNGFFADDFELIRAGAPHLRFYTLAAQMDFLRQFVTTLKTPNEYPMFGHKEVRPFKFFPIAVAHDVSGLSPRSLHFHGVLSFMILSFSYFLFLWMWGMPPAVATLCSAVLVVHPTSPYFAAWITERVYGWMAILAIWATAAFIRGLIATSAPARIAWAAGCAFLYAFGLLINEIIVPLPAFWAFIVWYRYRALGWRKMIAPAAAFVLPSIILAGLYVLVWVITVSGREFAAAGEHASSFAGKAPYVLPAVYLGHVLEVMLQQVMPYWNVTRAIWLIAMACFGALFAGRLGRDSVLRRRLTPALAWCVIFSLPFFTFPGARTHPVVYLCSPVLIVLTALAVLNDAGRWMQGPRKDWRGAVRHLVAAAIVMLFAVALIQTNRSLKGYIEAPPVGPGLHTNPDALRTRAGECLKGRLFY